MTIKVAMLGCGTVGSGFLEVYNKYLASLSKEEATSYELCKILIHRPDKYKNHPLYHLMTTDFDDVLIENPNVIIEVMGGVTPAKDYLLKAMSKSIHVITANKDLIAEHGEQLFEIANQNKVFLGFEASVGGGIPIIKPLKDSLKNGDIYKIEGVINGTCNFILSKMTEEEIDYKQALDIAVLKGFAELNPSSDVSGLDSARKLAILSSLAFSELIKPKHLNVSGIETIGLRHIQLAKINGFKIKLVAQSLKFNQDFYGCVRPMFIADTHPFYKIDKEYNSVRLHGKHFGKMDLSGKGAGKLPTASAVLGDFLDFVHERYDTALNYPNTLTLTSQNHKPIANDWAILLFKTPSAMALGQLVQSFSDHKLSIEKSPKYEGIFLQVADMQEFEILERMEVVKLLHPEIRPELFPLLK